MKNNIKVLSLVLALVLLLSGCSGSNGNDSSLNFENEETIKLGFIGCLTGGAAVYGQTSLNGAKLAVDEINANGGVNGKNIELVTEDDKNDTTEGINAYNKIREDVFAIIGSITSAPGEAFADLAKEDGMPMVTPTGTQYSMTQGRDNVFRVCFTDPYQGQVLAQYIQKSGISKVAIMINNSSDYSDGIFEAFKEEADKIGLAIVANESYGEADTDFRVQLTNIKNEKPEALVVGDYYEIDALIATQADELGLNIPIYGSDGWDGVIQQVDSSSYDVLENVYFANHYSLDDPDENIQNFIANYRRTYNDDPTAFSALSYDTVYLYKQAIEEAGKLDREAVIDAIDNIEFEGVTGSLVFDENNNPVKSVSIIAIKNGEYKLEEMFSPE